MGGYRAGFEAGKLKLKDFDIQKDLGPASQEVGADPLGGRRASVTPLPTAANEKAGPAPAFCGLAQRMGTKSRPLAGFLQSAGYLRIALRVSSAGFCCAGGCPAGFPAAPALAGARPADDQRLLGCAAVLYCRPWRS